MNLVADECCDAVLVAGLRSDGHDVLYIKETLRGAADDAVLQLAFDQQRILLTEDKDFGDLVMRLRLPSVGVVLVRMDPADTPAKLLRLRALLHDHGDRLTNAFVVVDETKFRIRPLGSP
jgi:predicted nuclease of predicted toxin-antitoxin system